MISIASRFVPVFLGKGYDEVIRLLYVMMWNLVVIGVSSVIGTAYLIPTKKHKEYNNSVFAGMVVNVILNLCLIPTYKAWGAAIATLLAEIVVSGVQLWSVRRDFSIRIIGNLCYKYLAAGIIMYLVLRIENYFIADTVIGLIFMVATGGIIYFTVIFLMRDEFLIEILKKLE